jgi:DNA-directed RNA polymerase
MDPSIASPINPQKQASAFPPNFIHSLDASHMMLSALACHKQNITFASVHDSYWTHACDVDKMNSILRNAFVRLHSEDIMKKLRDEFLERYASHKIPLRLEIKSEADRAKLSEYFKRIGKKTRNFRFIQTWTDFKLPDLPQKGQLDLESVKNSKYFFH